MLLNKNFSLRRKLCVSAWSFSFLLVLGIQACALTASLPEEKTVYIDDKSQILLSPMVATPKYLFAVPNDQLRKALIEQMTSTMGYNKLRVVANASEAEFRVEISSAITFSESSSPYTVTDASSPYNGVTFQLSTCAVSYDAKLYHRNTSTGIEKYLEVFSISENKEEKVKNSRTLGQMVTGSNKEKDEYRLKGLRDDIMKEVAEKGGKAGANRICSKIARLIKKGKL